MKSIEQVQAYIDSLVDSRDEPIAKRVARAKAALFDDCEPLMTVKKRVLDEDESLYLKRSSRNYDV